MNREKIDALLDALVKKALKAGASKEDISDACCGKMVDIKSDGYRINPKYK